MSNSNDVLLDIIVPHHNESLDIIRPFFDILENQKGVNFSEFKVWLLNNGDEPVPDIKELWGYKKLNLEQIQITENPGVSYARNYGLERATGEWVCFCDCDDCYVSIFSLMMILHSLKDEKAKCFDLIWGPFYMHASQLIKTSEFDGVFIHNKYYRREFLMDHGIRFNENLRMSEDSAFNTIVRLELGFHKIGQISSSDPLYAWCRRPGSVTVNPSKWIYISEGHFDRNLYILDEYRTRRFIESDLMLARTITDAYAMLNKFDIVEDPTPFRKRLAAFYKENKFLFERVTDDLLKQALAASDKDACTKAEELSARLPLKDWLNELEKEFSDK